MANYKAILMDYDGYNGMNGNEIPVVRIIYKNGNIRVNTTATNNEIQMDKINYREENNRIKDLKE